MYSSLFHLEALLIYWLSVPGIIQLKLYLASSAVIFILACTMMNKRKQKQVSRQDKKEAHFQYLIRKKAMLEEELIEMKKECEEGSLSNEIFLKKKKELEKYLKRTNTELQQYYL